VARGEKEILVEPHFGFDLAMQAGYLADLCEQFSFLDLRFSGPQAQENAQRVVAREEDEARKVLERKRKATTGDLHQALHAYHACVTTKYAGRSNQRPQQRLVSLLNKHSLAMPLEKFDAD
jgi:succinate dehydrogenase/fumarate reductase-like Fe-S protein